MLTIDDAESRCWDGQNIVNPSGHAMVYLGPIGLAQWNNLFSTYKTQMVKNSPFEVACPLCFHHPLFVQFEYLRASYQ